MYRSSLLLCSIVFSIVLLSACSTNGGGERSVVVGSYDNSYDYYDNSLKNNPAYTRDGNHAKYNGSHKHHHLHGGGRGHTHSHVHHGGGGHTHSHGSEL